MSLEKDTLFAKLNSYIMPLCLVITFSLLAWLSVRFPLEYDWTRTGRHQLSPVTIDLLSKIPDSVQITAYTRQNEANRQDIRNVISKYQKHKPDINLEFVNPNSAPDEARALGISVDGELIISYQNRHENLKSYSEQSFVNALNRLLRQQDKYLLFVSGHGERDGLGEANYDLGFWGEYLSSQGYKLTSVNLSTINQIPENTNVLIIAGPRVDYLNNEIDMINTYIDNGGNLFWLHDPGALYGLDSLAEKLQISFHPGIAIDPSNSQYLDPSIMLITEYPPHPATESFRIATLFPLAVGINALDSESWQMSQILTTNQQTWHESDYDNEIIKIDDEDIPGPLVIGLSLEREVEKSDDEGLYFKQQRVAVIGDGDFVSNTYLENAGNNELATRLINWLSSDDDFITIPPKVATDTNLELPLKMRGIAGLVFVYLLPLGLIITGIVVVIRRRRS